MVGDFDTNMDMEVDNIRIRIRLWEVIFKILDPIFQLSNIKAK